MESEEELCCRVCKKPYNLTDRLPRTMNNCCGEAVCSSCIQGMLKRSSEFRCPFDSTPYVLIDSDVNAFVVNASLKRIIEKRMIKSEASCRRHAQAFSFMCMTCQEKVCNACIHSGFHKSHDLSSLDQSYSEVLGKKDELETKINELGKLYKKIDTLILNKQKAFLDLTGIIFKRIREKLNDQERKFSSEIKTFFSGEQAKIRDYFGGDSKLNRRAQDILSSFNENRGNGLSSFPKLMTDVISSFDELLHQDLYKDYSQTLDRFYNMFDTSLKGRADQLFALELPFKSSVSENSGLLANENKNSNYSPTEKSSHSTAITPLSTEPFSVKSEHIVEEEPIRNEVVSKTKKDVKTSMKGSPQVYLAEISQYISLKIKEGCLIVHAKDLMGRKESSNIVFDVDKWEKAPKAYFRLGGYEPSAEGLKALKWVVLKLEKLTNLKVDFIYQGVVDDQLIKVSDSIFQCAEQLEEVNIDLRHCSVGDESISFLAEKIISRMKGLRIMNLNLSLTKVSQKSLKLVFEALQPMLKNLHTLQLYLSKISFEDRTITSLLTPMSNLKKLVLDLSYMKAPDNIFEALFKEAIPSLRILEEFEIDLSFTNIPDQALMNLFVYMSLIRIFVLKLEKTLMTDKCLTAFLDKSLSNMEYLEQLDLNIKQTGVTSKGIDSLIRSLPKVKTLRLIIGGMSMSNTNFESLGSKLNQMKCLEVLEMDFEKAKILEQSFCKIFVLLPNLKSLALNFGNASFTDKLLKAFTENTLKYLKHLKKIKLILSGTQITDQSLKLLLMEMKDVRIFKLYLRHTKITDQGIDLFVKSYKRILKNLEEFEMDLENTKVSNLLTNEVKDITARLPRKSFNF